MSNTVPGVYLSEVLSPSLPTGGVSTSIGCFVGAHPRGPVGPTRVTSFQRFTTLFGGFVPGVAASDLLYAVYLFFNNGGREAYITRVLDGNETTSTIGLLDGEAGTPLATLTVNALNAGSWGNAVSVDVDLDTTDGTRFSLTVYYGGVSTSNLVERFLSLTMDPADPRYAPSVINSPDQGSAFISVVDNLVSPTATLSERTPADTATPVTLAGGADSLGAPTTTQYGNALTLLDSLTGPLNINLPGVTSATLVNPVLAYAALRGNAFVVVDGLTGVSGTPTSVALQTARTGLYTGTSYGAVYFPRPVISDPSSRSLGAVKAVPAGGAILGIYANIDATDSVAKAPAGFDTQIKGAVGLEIPLTDADLATLQNSRTNAVRNIPGAGVVLMGARTLTTSGQVDRYISARRTLIYIKSELKSLLGFSLFANNDALLQQRARNLTDRFLRELWTAKGLRGASEEEAYFVVCDSTNNDSTTQNNGELRIKVGVALQTPAEFINIEVGQFDGVISAVEAA